MASVVKIPFHKRQSTDGLTVWMREKKRGNVVYGVHASHTRSYRKSPFGLCVFVYSPACLFKRVFVCVSMCEMFEPVHLGGGQT